ncbi:hypothetical protein ELY21_08200 [Legionella sp. km535]|uniref:hypothetical protein n=1 Tax=Legionella sp. km535 TaxID=2498107 RepID=UPI000F8D5F7A|nr:hypothetical protein [Legionella sp. km535]RUR18431.1 hypothetical protein ELY21_08200 [Legionella sp. km535]
MNKIKLPDVQDKFMWDIWMSMYHLPILTVADELALFEHLIIGSLSLIELAEELRLSCRSIEILAKDH